MSPPRLCWRRRRGSTRQNRDGVVDGLVCSMGEHCLVQVVPVEVARVDEACLAPEVRACALGNYKPSDWS